MSIAPERTPSSSMPHRIRVEDRDRWTGLLILAIDRRIQAIITDTENGVWADVDSYSRPWMSHTVEVWIDTAGRTWGRCSCEALNRCTHLALTIDKARMWPEPLYADHELAPGSVEANEAFAHLVGGDARKGAV